MNETLEAMSFPIGVLIVAGLVILGVAWWAAHSAEGHDEWLWGDDE